MARSRTKAGSGGFSLLDAMATLTLVAIVGTIAAPMTNRYVDASRLRAAGWSLASDLHRARQRAVNENRSQRLTLAADDLDPGTGAPRSYTIGPVAGGAAERRAFPRDVVCLSAPGTWVEFNSRGLASGSVEMELGGTTGSTMTVRVRSTGQVDFPG